MGDLTRNVQVIFPMPLLNKERPIVLTKGCSENLTIWYIKGKRAYYTHVQRYHHLITRLWFDSRKKNMQNVMPHVFCRKRPFGNLPRKYVFHRLQKNDCIACLTRKILYITTVCTTSRHLQSLFVMC